MITILRKIFNIFKYCHKHRYNKPIVSLYATFEKRWIIWECKCGAKICKSMYRAYGDAFPIETNVFMSKEEFNTILKSDHVYKAGNKI